MFRGYAATSKNGAFGSIQARIHNALLVPGRVEERVESKFLKDGYIGGYIGEYCGVI